MFKIYIDDLKQIFADFFTKIIKNIIFYISIKKTTQIKIVI